MTISIWRYSHLTLAITTSLFLIIASITGVILAFEPISNQLKGYTPEQLNNVSIAEVIGNLEDNCKEIITIEIDENNFVSASIISNEGKNETFYVNPKTGDKIGNTLKRKPLFEFATNLHRSLFLKSTGRVLVAFFSFLVLLIVISGIFLIAKRQGGFSKLFSKVIKDDFNQYYHVIFGKYFFLPILLITITGILLSLEKFSLLPENEIYGDEIEIRKENKNINKLDFEVFNKIKLDDVKKIEFPFSKDSLDYFLIQKKNKEELNVHQYNGQITSVKKTNFANILSYYSIIIHTGRGTIIWSSVLLITCIVILFFIYSGFSITLKRKSKKIVFKNKFDKDEAEIILLYGSETGGTKKFTNDFFTALISAGKKVYMASLNEYSAYEKASSLIIFTATYGNGEAPENGDEFLEIVEKTPPLNPIKFSILGFGSTNFPEFCKFAEDVNQKLNSLDNFSQNQELHKVDDESFTHYKNWVNEWSEVNKVTLNIDDNFITQAKNEVEFTLVKKIKTNADDTYLIELKPSKKIEFTSGDLLSIIPKDELRQRLYSIAKIDGKVVLSIKLHDYGICSNFLYNLNNGDKLFASIQKNEKFHFPKKAKEVVLIANGTGIAPFLGMIKNNKKTKIHLFWGSRNEQSIEVYENYLDDEQLSSFHKSYSKSDGNKVYIQNIVAQNFSLFSDILKSGSEIMICGSLNMQKGVEVVINEITEKSINKPLSYFKSNNKIKTDCY